MPDRWSAGSDHARPREPGPVSTVRRAGLTHALAWRIVFERAAVTGTWKR